MLDPDILDALVRPFNLQAAQLEFLRSSQNFVYSGVIDSGRTIVRVSTLRHRTEDEIEAELDWVSFLIDYGIRACRPIPTEDGRLTVALELRGQVYVCACFEHAPGAPIPRPTDNATYAELGRLIGRMHVAAREANNGELRFNRPEWQDSRLLKEDRAAVRPALSPEFERGVAALIERAGKIAPTPGNYGLIHGDAQLGNCFQHEGELWIFDFDNCEYGYFLQDLAVVLYDAIYCRELRGFADPGLNERVCQRWVAFMTGYSETGVLSEIRSDELKTFFLLREAVIHVHYHRTLDVKALGDSFREGLGIMSSNVSNLDHQLDFDDLAWPGPSAP